MRRKGKLTNWKEDRGFGFITPSGGGERVFVHIKSFSNRRRRPLGNELVVYDLATDAGGRARAENVGFVGDGELAAAPSSGIPRALALAGLFLTFIAAAVYAGKLPPAILGLYLGASVVAFLAYALDKSAARRGRWRTPENTLHLFGLIGGWPGALVAQKTLRHKSSKRSFKILFWVTVMLNCGALGWLFSYPDSLEIHAIIGRLHSVLDAMSSARQ
jgi:uncharacterized membrane protein YsdA (DUF1294 family)/cold shock CspA family protein